MSLFRHISFFAVFFAAVWVLSLTPGLSVGVSPALGQGEPAEKADGTYTVTFSQVTNNCDEALSLSAGPVRLTQKKSSVEVSIPTLPTMIGNVNPRGKFKAKARNDKARRFSVAGTAASGTIRLLIIAETYQGDKPVCTQSWNGRGARKK